jgi:hypothetical protein
VTNIRPTYPNDGGFSSGTTRENTMPTAVSTTAATRQAGAASSAHV